MACTVLISCDQVAAYPVHLPYRAPPQLPPTPAAHTVQLLQNSTILLAMRRTSYLCVATHASARELAAAAAAAAAGTPAANPPEAPPSAPPGGTPHTPAASTVNTPGVATPAGGSSKRSSCSGGGDGGGDTRVATDGGAKPAAGQSLPPQPPPLLPPLQAARLAHEAACNGQLLLLFLACDIVLVALEQGGAGAGAGGVEGAVPWMARLRQLQVSPQWWVEASGQQRQGCGLPRGNWSAWPWGSCRWLTPQGRRMS